MSDEGAKPSQPPEAGSPLNVGSMYWLGRRSRVWLTGDPYADLALAAIREREQMALLEDEPRYGEQPSTTSRAVNNRWRRSARFGSGTTRSTDSGWATTKRVKHPTVM